MKNKKFVCLFIIGVIIFSGISSFAMSTVDFDNGMRKGIDYFNKGLYYEARDEFQWFCDANWGKMNTGQQKYALDYLGGAKEKIQEWERKNYHSVYNGNYVAYNTSWGYRFNVTISNATENSLTAQLWVSNSDVIVDAFKLYRKANGSYYGVTSGGNELFSYSINATIWLESPNSIVLNDGFEIIRLYR